DHVTQPDFLHRSAFALDPAAAGGDDQCLSQRVRVPRGPCARLERDAGTADADGCEPLRLISMVRWLRIVGTVSVGAFRRRRVSAVQAAAWSARFQNAPSPAR